MEKKLLKGIALVVMVTAVVVQLSEASCGGGSRPVCTTDANCPEGWICLAMDTQPGVSKCWNCTCNETSQCVIEQGKLVCNCSQTGNYYGSYCQCPPVSQQSCGDVLSLYSQCNEYSDDQFEVLENRNIYEDEVGGLRPVLKERGYSESECKSKCVEKECHAFSFAGTTCKIYNKSDTVPYLDITSKIVITTFGGIFIRECVDC